MKWIVVISIACLIGSVASLPDISEYFSSGVKTKFHGMVGMIDWKVLSAKENDIGEIFESSDMFDCITPTQRGALNTLLSECQKVEAPLRTKGVDVHTVRMVVGQCFFGTIVGFNNRTMQADEIKMRAFIGNTSLTTDQKNLAVTKLRKCFTGNATVPEQIVRNVLSNQRILHSTVTSWISHLMNGHESVVMAKMKEAKPSLINLKAMMCLIGSILMNGCPKSVYRDIEDLF